MKARSYVEFEWSDDMPANGESGRGLAEKLLVLIQDLPSINTICDLGCGNGYLANELAERGYTVFGVDASSSGIVVARRGSAEFVQSEIDGSIRNRTGLGEVDLVISSDVLEHLYRPADLLDAAVTLLKPNGQIVITTPYHGYLKNLALSVSGRMDSHFSALHDGGHIKFFSVKSLSELMRKHSFGDLKFSYYGRAWWLWKNMICHARRVR